MAESDDVLLQLYWFARPLTEALVDEESLELFLAGFGYELHGTDGSAVMQQLRALLDPPLQQLVDALTDGGDLVLLAQLVQTFSSIGRSPAMTVLVDDAEAFAAEIFDYLVDTYLRTQQFPVAAALQALGVVVRTDVATTDPEGRDLDYQRVELQWARLGLFIQDNGAWAHDVYGWGADPASDGRGFDHQLAIANLAALVESTQLGLAGRRRLAEAEADVFLANRDGTPVDEVSLPLWQEDLDSIDEDGQPRFATEAGMTVLPSGDLARPEAMGLALAPYARGNVDPRIAVTDALALLVEVDGAGLGGAHLQLSPEGVQLVAGDGTVRAAFEFGLTYARSDGSPVVLVGDAGGTRVEADSIVGSVGGDFDGDGDLFLAGGVSGLRVVVDLSEDGFLGAIVPGPIEIDAGDVLIGWRNGRGVYFEGGAGLTVVIPLHRELGPIVVHEVGIELDWESDLSVAVSVTADARLGPLFALVENAAVVVTIVPAPSGDGLIGRYDLSFGFRSPTGYAVALDAAPIEGGGLLSVTEHEYRGALALRFEAVGFSAFAILTTRLPDGSDGFSFVAAIFGEFVVPLGYGFFLTGLGGIIGINRTSNADALRQAVTSGNLDSLLFPADPIGQAAQILDTMAAVFPPAEGQHVFGPVAKLAFGQPPLIEAKLGLLLEVGAQIRVLILGVIGSDLPTKDVALVSLRVSFFGAIDLAARTISLDGSLEGSRVLTFAISGDMAARTGWAPRTDHVIAFGGLHPAYPRPANLPDLRRLSINFGGNNPRVTLSSYFAITTNSLQFGAEATLYARGPEVPLVGQLAAEGELALHALVYFHPFAFEARLGGSLSLLVDGEVVLGLGFSLVLSGPNPFRVAGRVWATVLGVEVEFAIDHSWGQAEELPPPLADPVALLRAGLADSTGLEPVTPTDRLSGVVFAADDAGAPVRVVDPATGVQYVQSALPLGVGIEKVGEAALAGGAHRYDLAVFTGAGDAVAAAPAEADFVRGHFWALTEEERLRAPAFERHAAGFALGGAALNVDVAAGVEAEYGYEVIVLESAVGPRVPAPVAPGGLADAVLGRWSGVHRQEVARPLTPEATAGPGIDPLRVGAVGYVAPDGAAAVPTLSALLGTKAGLVRTAAANPAVAAYVAAAAA